MEIDMFDYTQLPEGATFTRLPAMPARGAMFENGFRKPKARQKVRSSRLRLVADPWSEDVPKPKPQKGEMAPFTRMATQKLEALRRIPPKPLREYQRRTP
jgi:hypothetical protein